MAWELDWSRQGSTGTNVWARNATAKRKDSRQWKLRTTGYLRSRGVNTPIYRRDSWEVDWAKRVAKLVWARNPFSKMPSAREWHWIDFGMAQHAGIQWKPFKEKTGRYVNAQGYVVLTRRGMTQSEVEIAEKFNLFRGARKICVREHQLVAVKKFGVLLDGKVVRHMNGVKTDNREENILLGTTQENTMDHNAARLQAMYWHNKYDALVDDVLNGQARETLKQYKRVRGERADG